MSFIQRIEALLKEKKISKGAMLTDLGLNKNSFSAWRERGTIPSAETLMKIASYLGTTIDYLLSGIDSHKKNSHLEAMNSKEALKQFLVSEGVVPADRDITEEETKILRALADAFFNKGI